MTTYAVCTVKRYGVIDSAPAIWTDDEAWVFWHETWARWPIWEVQYVAGVLDELKFHRTFRVPPLPYAAFRQTD